VTTLPAVGEDCYLAHGAHIGPNVRLGRNVRVGPGAVIGWDGFGFDKQPDGTWERKPETHGVVIGDDVEIGANACIDRGSYRDTVIGDGTKVDNLVHVAHNVQIGRNCLVIAGAELSGSVIVGDGAWIAPNACVREHLTVGEGAVIGLGAVVVKDVEANTTVAGNPARVLP
jgi:UDP-3-O-[3-hydroxymyristoyl] glucosamine N-acyltransferase